MSLYSSLFSPLPAPRGLILICLCQSALNATFYGLKSIFVLFSISSLGFDQNHSISLFAAFMSLSYGTALLGGYIADQYLGTRRALIFGNALTSLGLGGLILLEKDYLPFILTLISLGSGFLKPNLTASMGLLFNDSQDPRKDRAFSIYYAFMNLGSLLGPSICGILALQIGWTASLLGIFGFMMINLFFIYTNPIFEKAPLRNLKSRAYVIFASVCLALFFIFSHISLLNYVMLIVLLGSFAFLGKILLKASHADRAGIIRCLSYIFIFALFCSFFEQAGSSLMLFLKNNVDRSMLGSEIPSSSFMSFNSIFVLLLTPLLLLFVKNPSTNGYKRIATGFIWTGIAFILLSIGTFQSTQYVNLYWVIVYFFAVTMGEILVVPTILSNISKHAPDAHKHIMMSFWLLAISYGHHFAGLIAQFSTQSAQETGSLTHYTSFFFYIGLVPIIFGIVILAYFVVYLDLFKRDSQP